MLNYRKVTAIICLLVLIVSIVIGIIEKKATSVNSKVLSSNYDDSKEITDLPDDNMVDSSFYSHLPLIVIDKLGNDFIVNKEYDSETRSWVDIADPELSFTKTKMYIYDSKEGNQLTDEPTIVTDANMKLRGNTSYHYDKNQYLVKFVDENGKNKNIDVLGMESDNTWVLNGSLIDKSFIRNKVPYDISREIMSTWIDSKYCEVLVKNGDSYEYMGLYLMMESVKKGDNRVQLTDYRKKYAETAYLLKRDRYDKWETILNNYAFTNKISHTAFTLKYPYNDEITEGSLKYIEDDISEFEKILYSDDVNIFLKYRDYIDMDSFTTYFVINEVFGSYDAGKFSTYVHKPLGGKITMGPVWDFDGAMDNYKYAPLSWDATAFQESEWYDRMLMDPYFCKQLIIKYEELRKGILSNESIINRIDNNVKYIGKAADRDWDRWSYFYVDSTRLQDGYNSHNELVTNRNVNTHEEEIQRTKDAIINHVEWLDKNTGSLYMKVNTVKGIDSESINNIDNESKLDGNSILASIFIFVFITAIILIQKH